MARNFPREIVSEALQAIAGGSEVTRRHPQSDERVSDRSIDDLIHGVQGAILREDFSGTESAIEGPIR